MRRIWLIFSQAVTVAVAVLFVLTTLKPEWLHGSPSRTVPDVVSVLQAAPPPAGAGSAPGSYAPAAQRATPAVVSITASKAPRRNPHADDPVQRFFFGEGSRQQTQIGLGSGVIASGQGYLLTNNHVIDGADDIEVLLSDGRRARAKLVGTDPETDLAVLRIDLDGLPVISFGDSDALRVGDVVLAIGNPFGVGQTVTAGIVSALGRSDPTVNMYASFIQTDAAINPGNSGGALIDVQGNLVGLNTAIYSPAGGDGVHAPRGNLGIGFAIPASTVRQVLEGLIREGHITRGWIGVEFEDLTPEMAETLKLPRKDGVLVTGVYQGGPAFDAGLKPGDVVVRIAGAPIVDSTRLLSTVAGLKPASRAVVGVLRGDKPIDLTLTVAERHRRAAEQNE